MGTETKYYLEIPDGNGSGLGEAVSHIADVFIKVKQTKEHTEQVLY